MDSDGVLKLLTSSNSKKEPMQWTISWEEPEDSCSVYRTCGKFAICNRNSSGSCKCLQGFEPVNRNSADFSEGCQRTMSP